MRRIGFYLFIIAVFLLAPLLALPQKAVPAPAAAPTQGNDKGIIHGPAVLFIGQTDFGTACFLNANARRVSR